MTKIHIRKVTEVKLVECSQRALNSIMFLDGKLKIKGHLNLRWCRGIPKLPDELMVEGSVGLDHSYTVKILPIGLRIGGSLWICGSMISSLPDDLQVGDKIYYSYRKGSQKDERFFREIPSHLKTIWH